MSSKIAVTVALALAANALVIGAAHAQAQAPQVIVNAVPISAQQVFTLESLYGTPIAAGRYWYDSISGLWGPEGGPSIGQVLPGLPLGGPLRPDASGPNGRTGVFFNGREIHPIEYAALQQRFGFVIQGRYWLSPQGIGGVEGGPPTFNISTTARPTAPSYGPDDVNAPCVYVDNPDGSFVSMPGC